MARLPQKTSGSGLLKRIIEDLRLLFALIRDYWKGAYRDVSFRSMAVFTVCLVYILSPIDIIPDFNLGFGQIDDAAVFLLGLTFLEKDLFKYKAWKINHQEKRR